RSMNPMIHKARVFILLFLFLGGCAAASGTHVPQDNTSSTDAAQLSNTAPTAALPGDKSDLDKLASLWRARSQEKAASDYPIDVGDVVEISVPAIEELRSRTVRISGDGTIALPFVGK